MADLPPLVEFAREARRAADWADLVESDRLYTAIDENGKRRQATLLALLSDLKSSIARVEELLG